MHSHPPPGLPSEHRDPLAAGADPHLPQDLARVLRAQQMRDACHDLIARAGTEGELLHAICRIAVQVGGYRMGWIGMAGDDAQQRIEPIAHHGCDAEHLQELRRLSWSEHHPQGQGPAGVAVRTCQPVIVRDMRESGDFSHLAERMMRRGFYATVCLPLKGDGNRSAGLLYLYAPQALPIGQEEVRLLQNIASDLGFGIRSLRLHATQQRMQAALSKVALALCEGTGARFFDRLAGHLADALQAQVACVARLSAGADGAGNAHWRAQTLSYVIQGEAQPPMEYALRATPCELLQHERQLLISDGVCDQFPQAPWLAQTGARSFAGQQLTDSHGAVLGLLFVTFTTALADAPFVSQVLQIFAARAAAELERQQADSRIRQQASLLDKAPDAIIVCDMAHHITFWNQGAERLYGWLREEVLGHAIAPLLYQDRSDYDRANALVQQQGDWDGELVQHDRNARPIDVECRWTLVRNDQGEPEAILAIHSDIGPRKAHEREIQRLAFSDALTGLPNRVQLMERIAHALRDSQHGQQGGALLFIDLDNFKTLNDTLGHDRGDQLLQLVAQRLTRIVRGSDMVARLGGDEFVVLLLHLSADENLLSQQARMVGEKILSTLSMPYSLAGYQYRSTPSIGIASFGEHTSTVGELLQQADMAMYQAKAAGRNTLCFFTPQLHEAVKARATLEEDFRNALTRQEFTLLYQPQLNARGEVTGSEALLRWKHPQRGMVSPQEFIPLAEETGLIRTLGRWVLHQACSQLASWQNHSWRLALTMSVNVSPLQFRDADFIDDLLRILAVTGAPAQRLKLELTESLMVQDMQSTIATMRRLSQHGIRFSLDDFGTGYSSLSYLRQMPLDQLKIDQSFVHGLPDNASSAAIVRTIVALAEHLELEVVAEGVETLEQHRWLRDIGCRNFQGYLFSMPLPAHELHAFLDAEKLPMV